jgi:transketolase
VDNWDYIRLAKNYRKQLFEKFLLTKQGHPGSIFSMMDIMVALYHGLGGFVRFDPYHKKFVDKVLISKGHATAALYPIMKQFGVLPEEEWDNWGKGKSCLRIFGNTSIPGIDVTSGSLGHCVGVGVGMALCYKRDEIDKKVFVVISEGELYEGSTWEALLLAKHHNLKNLTIIVDVNNLIILGKPKDCVGLESISEKISGLGIATCDVDGHNFSSLFDVLERHTKNPELRCIVAHTVKGKGVSFMENKNYWHYYNKMTPDQISQARKELNSVST